MEVSTNNLLHQMERVQSVSRPVAPELGGKQTAIAPGPNKNASLAKISLRHVQP
jgi:hypothetical protein